jgi:phage FluMu gp28-like protein
MSALLPTLALDTDVTLTRFFMPHQINWIQAETAIHAQNKQVFALAEKSVRIGWTYCDAFKNVRKRLRFKNRDYLFVTRDYPSALEYMHSAYHFAELFDLTSSIISHGEEPLKLPRLDSSGQSTAFTEEIKVGVIKFDTGSRIIAFSANPQAMAVYGGDVGLDEFAKHPNAELLWETAQARITWGGDIAVWSAHNGEDTLFYQFCLQARAKFNSGSPPPPSASDIPQIENQKSKIENSPSSVHTHSLTHSPTYSPSSPWNLYYRVTMPDAIELGLVDVINQTRGTKFTPDKFLADCRARAGSEQTYQQAYLCNPLPGGAGIVDWSVIERCRFDYSIIRAHFEHDQIIQQFGEFAPHRSSDREHQITSFLHTKFLPLFQGSLLSLSSSCSADSHASRITHHDSSLAHSALCTPQSALRLGFDVAASGQGDLAVIYIDEVVGSQAWLRALFTCRTEDWHFLQTVLFTFMRELPSVQAAGDETGLGRQICWEASQTFGSRFIPVNFSSRKHDLGFTLMNQLSMAEKRFPREEQDIAADYFALRKSFVGKKWVFTESTNSHNPASHCDIAWAGALASEAHLRRKSQAFAYVC